MTEPTTCTSTPCPKPSHDAKLSEHHLRLREQEAAQRHRDSELANQQHRRESKLADRRHKRESRLADRKHKRNKRLEDRKHRREIRLANRQHKREHRKLLAVDERNRTPGMVWQLLPFLITSRGVAYVLASIVPGCFLFMVGLPPAVSVSVALTQVIVTVRVGIPRSDGPKGTYNKNRSNSRSGSLTRSIAKAFRRGK